MKIFVTAGDVTQSELYKSAGFNPVLLEWSDVLTSLQTGMVDALPTIPLHALSNQFYLSTHHMLEVNWIPLVGALIMTKKTWDALPPDQRDAMLKAAADCGQEFQTNNRQENQAALEAMKKRGLQVHPVSKEAEEEWRRFSGEPLSADSRTHRSRRHVRRSDADSPRLSRRARGIRKVNGELVASAELTRSLQFEFLFRKKLAEDAGEFRGVGGPVRHGPDSAGRELPAPHLSHGDPCFDHHRSAHGARGRDAGRSHRGPRRQTARALDPGGNGPAWALEEHRANFYQQRVGHRLSIPGLASYQFVDTEREAGTILAFGIPIWIVEWVLPLGFAVIAIRILLPRVGKEDVDPRIMATLGAALLVGDRNDLAGRPSSLRSDCDFDSVPGFGAGHARVRDAGWRGIDFVLGRGPTDRGDSHRAIRPGDESDSSDAAALHAGGLFSRRGRRAKTADTSLLRAVRTIPRRPGDRNRAGLRALHFLHRSFGRDDSCARRPADAGVNRR